MSDATADDLDLPEIKLDPPAQALMPRGEQAAEIARIMAAIRMAEDDRRWSVTIGRVLPYGLVVLMCVPLYYSLAIIKNRPVPKDRHYVSIAHADGYVEPAKEADDLTPSKKLLVLKEWAFNYVTFRVEYAYFHAAADYDRTRFQTYGRERAGYEEQQTKAEDRPTKSLGVNGERHATVTDIMPTEDAVLDVYYTMKLRDGHGINQPERRCHVTLTYTILDDMPGDFAQRYDPLKLVDMNWTDHPVSLTEPPCVR